MNSIKKLIARLLNIQPEVLQQPVPTPFARAELAARIREEVNRQVREQLQQLINEVVIPEIQKSISEQVRMIESGKQHEAHVVNAQKMLSIEENLPISTDKEIPGKELSIDEEFPEIDEEPQPVETIPFPVEGENQFIDSVVEFQPSTVVPSVDEDSSSPEETRGDEEVLPLKESFPQPIQQIKEQPLHDVSAQEIRIGIDFGTTTTAVSIKLGDERPEALPIGNDGVTRYIPSIVYFQPGSGDLENRAIVGEDAEAFGDQTNIIHSVKRCFGCLGQNCREFPNAGGELEKKATPPFAQCREGKIILSNGEAIDPGLVAYLIVREALRRAVRTVRERWQINLTLENVCLEPVNFGCGASFNLDQRKMICNIANELGFVNVKIDNVVEEPILAGFTFSRFAERSEGRALIYDFGGGTFDVAIVDVDRVKNKLRVTVVATAGENWLGGDDFDSLVYNHFLVKAASEVNYPVEVVEDMLGGIDRSRLRVLSRRAKETLSSSESYSDILFSQSLGPLNLELSRAELETLINTSGLLDKSLKAVRRACQLAYTYESAKQDSLDASKVTKHDLKDAAPTINKVILVGGVTKTPLIRDTLRAIFGAEKIVAETVVEPVSAVAIGGAYDLDPDHYCLAVPPYEIYLEYETPTNKNRSEQTIFQSYEYLDFHRLWVSSSAATYFNDFYFPTDLINAKLRCRKAGDNQPMEWCQNIGRISSGDWRFSVSMEGIIVCHKFGDYGQAKFSVSYPVTHPIQKAIREERVRRYNQARKKDSEKFGSYEDMIKGIMNEN